MKFQRDATLTGDVGSFRSEGQRPLVYIEPKGHGMEAYDDQEKAPQSGTRPTSTAAAASDAAATPTGTAARTSRSAKRRTTARVTFRVAEGSAARTKSVKLGLPGSSFRGVQGAENKARSPWGWFDMSERGRPLGEWFLDPAGAVRRHFPSGDMSTAYVHQPFLGALRN